MPISLTRRILVTLIFFGMLALTIYISHLAYLKFGTPFIFRTILSLIIALPVVIVFTKKHYNKTKG